MLTRQYVTGERTCMTKPTNDIKIRLMRAVLMRTLRTRDVLLLLFKQTIRRHRLYFIPQNHHLKPNQQYYGKGLRNERYRSVLWFCPLL